MNIFASRNYNTYKPLIGIAVLAFLVGVYGRDPKTSTAGKTIVHLGYFANLTHAPAIVGVARGDFQTAVGKQVVIDPKVFNAGPAEMEALSAGAIDIGYVGPSPAVNTFMRSHGKALRIVAGACSGGASLVARGNAHIATIEDLDGKMVAVPQLGGTQDVSLRHFLGVHALHAAEGASGGTVHVMPLKNPDILTEFKQGALDAAWVPEPWATRLIDEAHAVRVFDERDLWPGRTFTTTVVVARTEFLNAHPEIVRDVLRAHAADVAWIEGHSDEAAQLVNNQMNQIGSKSLKPALLKEAWGRVDFTADPDPANIAECARSAAEAGYLPNGDVDVDKLVDLSFLGGANQKDKTAKN
jgi:NitT/TauT family transport system substrate-binding protein